MLFCCAAPLRSPLDRFRAGADFTKRGGRYKSDFIWNTNWQEQVAFLPELLGSGRVLRLRDLTSRPHPFVWLGLPLAPKDLRVRQLMSRAHLQLAFEEAEEERRKAAAAKPAEQPSGFLSFGRLERLAE